MLSGRRWIINLASNVGLLITQMLIGVILTPFLIRHLGVAYFGITQFSLSTMAYLGTFTLVLHSALGRHLALSINDGKIDEARKIFNAGYWLLVLICVILLPGSYLLSMYLPSYLGINYDDAKQVTEFFFLMFLSIIILAFSSVYSLSAYVLNRLEIRSGIEILTRVSRFLLVFLLFITIGPTLQSVGMAFLVSALLALSISYYSYRRLTPYLKAGAPSYNKYTSIITKTSSWILVSQLSGLFFLQSELLVIAGLFGSEKLGQYAALIVIVMIFRSFASAISGVLNPVYFMYVSKGDDVGLQGIASRSMRLLGLTLAFPLGFVVIMSDDILRIWVSNEFSSLSLLLRVMLIHLVINLTTLPLMGVHVALDSVRIPALVSLALGVVNIILMIVFVKYTDLELIAIAMSGAIVLTIKNVAFTIIYTSKLLKVKFETIAMPLVYSILGFGVALIIVTIADHLGKNRSLFDLCVIFVISAVCYLSLVWSVIMPRDDKEVMMNIIHGKILRT